ncbi:alpha/beta hydrolase family esterase [Thiococcus pfennigii]|uniref:extracellular catalytic domain type 1 short-chain-length polyhydroxyalkanoate depolymerase n=1 Tax=Thiococcus pfennigii TaxID=1057 RepID=UPI0019033DEB|nr:PHB depolymerase family esterase [Thiococcus pfennigii]
MTDVRSPSAVAGRVLAGSFANPAGARDYRLHCPAGRDGAAHPLILMLHGCLQDPEDFAAGTRMAEIAGAAGAYVLYPGQGREVQPSGCWRWFEEGHQGRDAGEPWLLAELTRAIIAEQPIDPARVYVAGLSAGGAMASILAAAYPDLYAAAGVHSAPLYFAVREAVPPFDRLGPGGPPPTGVGTVAPIIVFHGDCDRVVHPIHGARIVAWVCAAHGGCGFGALAGQDGGLLVEPGRVPGGRAYTRTRYLDRDGRPAAEHWSIHGAGHAWSGGSPSGSYTEPLGPDASAEMLRFFAQFRGRSRRAA